MHTASEDVIDRLLAQHQQIKLLFAEMEDAAGDHRRDLFHDLVELLAVHESVEEILIHPLARDRIDGGEELIGNRLAEEQDAKDALAQLYDLGTDDPGFAARLLALRDAVIAHAEAEEDLEFSKLRAVVDPSRLEKMTTAMKTAEAMAPTRPHPGVPAGRAENLIAGPPLAVFDRIRDALRDATKKAWETSEVRP